MPSEIGTIVERLPEIEAAVSASREKLLANLVMIGEIPAPTFGEEKRIHFLHNRFIENGLANISTDEVHNGYGILPGSVGERALMVSAHTDTLHAANIDHTIQILPDRAIGAGIGDNSLGVAALATLPDILELIDYEFRSDLLLMGTTRSLGRGNLAGMKFFLENTNVPILAAALVEGQERGRLSYASLGTSRGEITVTVPHEYDWTEFGASDAIRALNDIVSKINSIPLPREPKTVIVFGSMEGGSSDNTFNTRALTAELRYEVRGESEEIVQVIGGEIEMIVEEVAAATRLDIRLNHIARRHAGGIPYKHSIVQYARDLMDALEIEPHIYPSTSELSALIDHNIPAITIGLTECDNWGLPNETIMLDPMTRGLTHLIGLLIAIDQEEIE